MADCQAQVTGVILAGGRARRMGSVEKGLLPFRGQPLAARAAERLRPQVACLFINANREQAAYAALGYPVIPDAIPDFAGPLAGLHAAMQIATTPFIASVPCDSPFFPDNLVERLHHALETAGADLAVAAGADLAVAACAGRRHPVFCLCRTALLPDLTRYLDNGGRKVEGWQTGLRCVEVAFDETPLAFANLNTPQELAAVT